MSDARIRLTRATLSGEILLEGQRAYFTANIHGPRVDAEFQPHPETERALDQWQLFRALEKFVDTNLRG